MQTLHPVSTPERQQRDERSAWPTASSRISTTTAGADSIAIGAREFMCVGALPPFDHPHVFIDMGDENEAICPYCSTVYRFDPSLGGAEARPEDCLYRPAA